MYCCIANQNHTMKKMTIAQRNINVNPSTRLENNNCKMTKKQKLHILHKNQVT